MKEAKQRKRSPLKVLAAILAIIVAILFVSAGVRISEESRGYIVDYDIRDYIYSAESGRYGSLYGTTLADMEKDAQYSTEVEECRALAFYYELAVLEHAYREAGENEKADEFAGRMKDCESQLGSLSGKAEAVRSAVSG